jgi:M6 family metalloprotease-like protein
LICTVVAKKKVWKAKPSTFVKFTAATYPWQSACELDPFVPSEWKEVQNYLASVNYCDAPYTILPVSLSAQKPTTVQTHPGELAELNQCKLKNQRTNGNVTGFANGSFPFGAHPGPNTRFQLIPIQTLDSAEPKAAPLVEYAKYVKYLENILEYISDGPSDVTFASPDHYIKMNVKLADYGIGIHGQPTTLGREFFNSAVKAVDPEIDFSKSDYSIVVIPAESKPNLLAVQPYASGVSAEGPVENMLSLHPSSAARELGNRDYLGIQPLGVFHELYHGGLGLDDHYGDQRWQLGADLGMANWGLMSTIKSDLAGWEKWIVGFTLDSQVRCADPNKTSTHWLIPGGVKSTNQKLLVVPLSATKAIVVESLRPAGVNYKIPKVSQGALVYTVDVADQRHGYGMQLVVSEGRILEKESQTEKFIGASAPLKLNQSVVVDGIQIKVIEAGVFGDVIKVSKAG